MQSKTPGTASGGAHTIGGWSGPTPFCFGGGDAAIPPSHSSQNDMPSNRQLSNSIGRKRCPSAINACPSGANEATHLCSRHNATHHIKKRLFANNAQKQQQQQQLVEKDMQKHQSSALQTSAGAMISGIPLLQGSQNPLTAVTGQENPPGLIASRTVHVDVTITKRQAFIPMTFAREIMGDANSCVVTLQIMVDGENRQLTPDVELVIKGNSSRKALPIPRTGISYSRYEGHKIVRFVINTTTRKQQKVVTMVIISPERAAQEAAASQEAFMQTGMLTYQYKDVRGGHHARQDGGANYPLPKELVQQAYPDASDGMLVVQLTLFRNGYRVAGPVDATVRVQEKRTWLYVPAAAHRSVLGCKLQRARAGRPTGTAAMDNARKVNLLELHVVDIDTSNAPVATVQEQEQGAAATDRAGAAATTGTVGQDARQELFLAGTVTGAAAAGEAGSDFAAEAGTPTAPICLVDSDDEGLEAGAKCQRSPPKYTTADAAAKLLRMVQHRLRE